MGRHNPGFAGLTCRRTNAQDPGDGMVPRHRRPLQRRTCAASMVRHEMAVLLRPPVALPPTGIASLRRTHRDVDKGPIT